MVLESLFQQEQKLDRPAVNRKANYLHTAPLQHFFTVPVTQKLGGIPPNAD